MKKQSQSLLDFINIFPLQAIIVRHQSPVSNKEAQTLFNIWNTDRDNDGDFVVPQDADATSVASLTTKGMINSHNIGFIDNPARKVKITDKGANIIRNIILFTEKSRYEKDHKSINYESIHQAIQRGPKKHSSKIKENWLKKQWK